MRGPLDPEQLLSPELLKSANTLLSVCLAVIAALGTLAAIWSLLTLNIVSAIWQGAAAITFPLSIWMIVRLLSELLIAQQSINERLILLNDTQKEPSAIEPVDTTIAPDSPKTTPVTDPVTSEPEANSVDEHANVEDDVDAAIAKKESGE